MPFPVVEGVVGSGVEDTATKEFDLPTGIQAGDLLVACWIGRTSGTNTPPSGWTLLDAVGTSFSTSSRCWYKIADGSESGTVTYTDTGSPHRAGTVCYRISGVDQDNPIEGDWISGIDPPSLSPSWGSADTLWISSFGKLETLGPVTPPTGYSNLTVGRFQATSSSNWPSVWTADKTAAAASEDPGTWIDGGGGSNYSSGTFAIQPIQPIQPNGGNRIGGTGAIRRRPRRGTPPPGRGGGPPPGRGGGPPVTPPGQGPPPDPPPPSEEPPEGTEAWDEVLPGVDEDI